MESATREALALFHSGEQHLQAGAWQQAERAFRQALSLDARFAEAQGNLAYVLDQAGDSAQAESQYRAALALAPGNATLHLNLGALLALLPVLTLEDIEAALTAHMPGRHKNLLPKNIDALKRGAKYAQEHAHKAK